MNVLVTGAAGLVGYHLCRRLVSEGHHVVGMVHSTVNPALLALDAYKFRAVRCDIRDQFAVNQVVKDSCANTVFHLAACLPHTPVKDFFGINVQGTANLLRASQYNRAATFIYASSMSVYSTPPNRLPVNEACPVQPSTDYGLTKLEGELLCASIGKPKGVAILRLAGVYGEYSEKERVINKFIRCALGGSPISVDGDGLHSSDFAHVDDIVQGVYSAWQKRVYGVYNIGSGQETTLKDLADTIVSITGSKSDIVLMGTDTDRPFRFYLDITKARTAFGYSPKTVRGGLQSYIRDLKRIAE